jgi:endonuclease/exonuclease/phosphatase family metal-dependent hydrolase
MSLRVMTYNILDGAKGREEYVCQVLQTVEPDVAILQEVYDAGFVKKVGQALKMTAFFVSGNRKRRVALLSRLPVHSCQSYHPFPPIWRNVVEANIEHHSGKRIWIFGIHPLANLSVICELWRWWEAKQIIGRIEPHMAEPCLLAGDFNAIAPRDRVATETMPQWLKLTLFAQGNHLYRFSIREYLSSGLADCFRTLHPDEDGFTLPPPHPNSRLDYIFVNKVMKAELLDCRVVREPSAVLKASDHFPVVAEFRL